MAFLLVIAGALVTSNDAGGAIPDWPLSWGRLVPPLEGGIVYAYGHRVLAATVALLTLLLALQSRSKLAWAAFAAIVAQALVGGLVTKVVAPKFSTLLHATLAQLCFGMLIACTGTLRRAVPLPSKVTPATLAVIFVFAQTILGAALRHHIIGVVPHVVGAVVTTMIVLWAVVPAMMDHMLEAGALLGITAFQIFLGMGAYFSRSLDAPQPMPLMVFFTTAHAVVGSMAFGAAILLALACLRRSESELGGTAVA